MAYLMNSHMRTNNGYVKMTENESTFTNFTYIIAKIFPDFCRKSLYESFGFDI